MVPMVPFHVVSKSSKNGSYGSVLPESRIPIGCYTEKKSLTNASPCFLSLMENDLGKTAKLPEHKRSRMVPHGSMKILVPSYVTTKSKNYLHALEEGKELLRA